MSVLVPMGFANRSQYKIIVSWNTMNASYSDFMESSKKILGNIDWLFQL